MRPTSTGSPLPDFAQPEDLLRLLYASTIRSMAGRSAPQ